MSNTKTAKSRTKTAPTKAPIANQPQTSPDTTEETAIEVGNETTTQSAQMEQPNNTAMADESGNDELPVTEALSDENRANEGQHVVDEDNNACKTTSGEDTNVVLQAPQHSEGDAAPDAQSIENVSAEAPSPRKQMEQTKRNLGPRYEAAKIEVARLRQELLDVLDEKAALLGTQRVGEAVPLRHVNSAIEQTDQEIRRITNQLEVLRQRKRELVNGLVANPEDLEAVNRKIRRITMEREAARTEKKRAYQEATIELE